MRFPLPKEGVRYQQVNEFDNTNIKAYCDEIGIKHEVSSTYTPQQNGVVERKNRTLITLARTMLDEYNTPKNCGPRQLTPHAMHQIASSYKSFLARPPMSC
jgi:transposase InsO family protein